MITLADYASLRYGLFLHYGLYSRLERGEWVMNREQIPSEEYQTLAGEFTAEKFDADALCDLAVRAGMKYVVFTTMHHDGFRLYDTARSEFNTAKTASGRDLTGAPQPWRPWEACLTLNDNWAWHPSDHHWKTPAEIVDMLAAVAAGWGNLLLGIGPRPDGSVPPEAAAILETIGGWLERCGEAIFETDVFQYSLTELQP